MWDFAVKVGDKVKAGEVVGRSDNTGNSTGPHLHFELRKNNVAVDPAPLLTAFLPGGEAPGGGVVIPGGGEEQPGGEVPVGEEPAAFPSLPMARIISTVGLNIRMAPGVANPIVGYLPTGSQVEVLRKALDGDDIWLQIGFQQFIAMNVAGDTFAVWAPQPPATPQAGARRSRRKSK